MQFRNVLMSAVLVLAVASPTVFAKKAPLALDLIREQQAEIRTGVLSKNGIYADMNPSTRVDLLAKQEQILSRIEGKETSDQLDKLVQDEVFNDLEWIEAAINSAEDERMVCERRRVIGSNHKVRECMTVGQRRRERERARDEVVDRNVGR